MTLRVGTHTSLITLALGLVLVEREIIPAAMASCSSEAASQPVTRSAAVAAVISPTSGLKRKLGTCHLPEQKTSAGRPKKQRALDHYRFSQNIFLKKQRRNSLQVR